MGNNKQKPIKQIELWEKFEDNLFNKGITQKRMKKLKHMFIVCERAFKKSFDEVTREDVEKFVSSLHRNTFKRIDGSNYRGTTKSDIKKFLKQFWKWYKGDDEVCTKEVSWIKTNIGKDEKATEKPVLSIKEVEEFARGFKKTELQLLVLILFDSGFRIQEMLSVRKKDLTWESFGGKERCFWIACNESKTETRKIPIPLFTEDIQNFYNSLYYRGLSENDKLFNIQYKTILMAFSDNSKRLYKGDKKITPHALRHSSATYYAKEFNGNMNTIATRYGWSFSSKELKTYIRRSGAYQKEGAKQIFVNETKKLKEEIEELKEEIKNLPSKILKQIINNPKDIIEALNLKKN